MATTPPTAERGSFFSSSAARLDRWRELNAKAQAWAAEARSGNVAVGAPRRRRRSRTCARSRTSLPIRRTADEITAERHQ